jgi:hypothetical protein
MVGIEGGTATNLHLQGNLKPAPDPHDDAL